MDFSDIDTYLHKITPKRDRVLVAMERYAKRNGFPIIGPLVGRYLYQTARLIKARKILELGSGYGYSAFWFALAVGPQARIIMTDMDQANRDRAFMYFEEGGLEARFTYHLGNALKIAAGLKGPYDIILNDIDKQDYPQTIDLAADLLRPGGLFITDNIIWSGRVYDSAATDAATRGVKRFPRMLSADDRFFTSVLPLRDGISVAMRI